MPLMGDSDSDLKDSMKVGMTILMLFVLFIIGIVSVLSNIIDTVIFQTGIALVGMMGVAAGIAFLLWALKTNKLE